MFISKITKYLKHVQIRTKPYFFYLFALEEVSILRGGWWDNGEVLIYSKLRNLACRIFLFSIIENKQKIEETATVRNHHGTMSSGKRYSGTNPPKNKIKHNHTDPTATFAFSTNPQHFLKAHIF